MHYYQVALPGLHISLGVFHKFFKMLEDECSVLDIKIAEKLAEKMMLLEMKIFKVSLNQSKKCHVLKQVLQN